MMSFCLLTPSLQSQQARFDSCHLSVGDICTVARCVKLRGKVKKLGIWILIGASNATKNYYVKRHYFLKDGPRYLGLPEQQGHH